MQVQIPLVGQSYQHRDRELSYQSRSDWIPEIHKEANEPVTLQPFPGYKPFFTGGNFTGNGLAVFKGELYKVTDTALYKIASDGTGAEIGTISGAGKCSFAATELELVIVRDGKTFKWDGSTLTDSTDVDQESPTFVTVINNQAIYNGNGQRFVSSKAGDLTNINGITFAANEALPGALIRPYAFKDYVYMFSETFTKLWWNSARGNPPFDPVQNSLINIGLQSGYSVASNNNFIYFLGTDFSVYRAAGVQVQKVSTVPFAQRIKTYQTTDDAIGYCLTYDSKNLYCLYFPTGDTWCYTEQANAWFMLTTGYNKTQYLVTDFVECYDKQLVEVGSSVYELDEDSYTNDGETIVRENIMPPITAGYFNKQYEGRRVEWTAIYIIAKINGLLDGQGSQPKLMLSYSDNGGRTWSNERQMRAAELGQNTWKMTANGLGSSFERVLRIRYSDPTFCSLHSATADVELGIL